MAKIKKEITNKENTKEDIPKGQFLIYKTEDGKTKIDVRFDGETVWLTQQAIAELFQTSKQNISQHIISIYEEAELIEDRTVKNLFTVRNEGGRIMRHQDHIKRKNFTGTKTAVSALFNNNPAGESDSPYMPFVLFNVFSTCLKSLFPYPTSIGIILS